MILAQWLRSLRHLNDYFKLIDQNIYYGSYEPYIKSILQRTNTEVRLALLSDEPDVVLGWAVIENNTLHYVHVKEDQYCSFRNKGIATQLIPKEIKQFSHVTSHWLKIWPKKFSELTFNPFQ